MSPANGALREAQFVRVMRARGVKVVRPKRVFRFTFSTYKPDFYALATDTYYEVIGSRQRCYQMLATFDLMATVHPEIRLEIVTPDGEPVTFIGQRRHRWLKTLPWGAALEQRMRREGLSIRDLFRRFGLRETSFYDAMRGQKAHLRRLEAYALGVEERRSA